MKVDDATRTFEAFYPYSQSVIDDEGTDKFRLFIKEMNRVTIKYNHMLDLCKPR